MSLEEGKHRRAANDTLFKRVATLEAENAALHETITTMIATGEKRGLDPPTELIDVLRDHGQVQRWRHLSLR